MNLPNNDKEIDNQSEDSVNERRLENVSRETSPSANIDDPASDNVTSGKTEIDFPSYKEIDLPDNGSNDLQELPSQSQDQNP